MSRARLRAFSVVVASWTVVGAVACSSTPEQPILNQFFTASRLRDNTTLASFSTVAFEPASQGIITSFTITNVSPEQRKPLTLKSIAQSQEAAKAEDAAFMKRKDEYANENGEAVQRVLKGDKGDITGRWIVTGIKDAFGTGATPRS